MLDREVYFPLAGYAGPLPKDVRRGVRRRHCSRARWPRFPHLAPRPTDQTRDRKRHRSLCPNGATHTSPGHPPWEPHPREQVCSEGTPHRRDRGRGPRHGGYAAFLQNAELFCRVGSQGWHPGLVCDAHSGHGVRNRVRAWDWERIDVEGERYRTRQKTFGETFGAATGVSDPSYRKSESETTIQAAKPPL